MGMTSGQRISVAKAGPLKISSFGVPISSTKSAANTWKPIKYTRFCIVATATAIVTRNTTIRTDMSVRTI